MLRSNLCDYSDAYNVAKWKITVIGDVNANNAPFKSCISNISNTFKDNAEDLDIVVPMYNLLECCVMPMYNLLESCDNYSMTSSSFLNYYRGIIIHS